MKRICLFSFLFVLITSESVYSLTPDFIVSKDGSGNFSFIQEALNEIPSTAQRQYIIFIKNGFYNEKLFVEKSNIVLIGETKDSTKIIYA